MPMLLRNAHTLLECPDSAAISGTVRGSFKYYHYVCDGVDDRGWGCGYRTLQTICSWLREDKELKIPTLHEIQKILVRLNDKESSFLNSKQWIGTYESMIVINELYQVDCKIIHIRSGCDLHKFISTLTEHFQTYGSPIMMGGDLDGSSKCIVGLAQSATSVYILILDPHFCGKATIEKLPQSGYLYWQDIHNFNQNSFYNLCLPQQEAKES